MAAARRQMGWSPAVDLYACYETPRPFEEMWVFLKYTSHADHYRRTGMAIVRYRVEGAMRAAGFNEAQIRSYHDAQMENFSYGRDDAQLHAYLVSLLNRERTKAMMARLSIDSRMFSDDQLASFSAGKTEKELYDSLYFLQQCERTKYMMKTVGFSETEIRGYTDHQLAQLSWGINDDQLRYRLSLIKYPQVYVHARFPSAPVCAIASGGKLSPGFNGNLLSI
jgi:hypothetical protein